MALGSNSFNEQDFKRGQDIYDSSFDEQSFKTGGVDGGQAMNNSMQIKKVADVVKANNNPTGKVTAEDIKQLELTDEELLEQGYNQDQIEQINNIMTNVTGKSTSDFDKQFSDSSILPSSEQFLTANQPVRVGTYSGKVIGNVPIFAAPAALSPTNIIMKRASQLDKAAKARAKSSKKAMDALKFSTPEQFQKEIDDLTTDVINEYLNKSGGNYYKVTDRSTALGQQYAKDKARLSQIAKTVNAIDSQGREILKKVANGSEDVPTEVFETVTSFLSGKGKYSLKALMEDGGEKTLTNLRTTLQTFENRNNVIDKYVINKIKPNLIPALADTWENLDKEGKKDFKNLVQQTKLKGNQGKVALTSFIEKYYSDKDIREVVTEVLTNSNVYRKDDKEALEASINYVTSMLGNEIRSNTSLTQLYEDYDPSKDSSNDKVYDTAVYLDLLNNNNEVQKNLTNSVGGLNNIEGKLPEQNKYLNQQKNSLFNKLGLKPVGGQSDVEPWSAVIPTETSIKEGDQTKINSQFARYKGYSPQEYIKRELETINSPEDWNNLNEKDKATILAINGNVAPTFRKEDDGSFSKSNYRDVITPDNQAVLSGKQVSILEQKIEYRHPDPNIGALTNEVLIKELGRIREKGIGDPNADAKALADFYNEFKPTVIFQAAVQEPIKEDVAEQVKGMDLGDAQKANAAIISILFNERTKERVYYKNSEFVPVTYEYPLDGTASLAFLNTFVKQANTQLNKMDATQAKQNTRVSTPDQNLENTSITPTFDLDK